MAGPEKRAEAGFARWCREQGLFCLKLAAISMCGFPDRTVLLSGGRVVFIEFKSEVGKTSAVQDRIIGLLRDLGFKVLVTHSKAEAIDFVEREKDEVRSRQVGP